jgi:hypothetical protein
MTSTPATLAWERAAHDAQRERRAVAVATAATCALAWSAWVAIAHGGAAATIAAGVLAALCGGAWGYVARRTSRPHAEMRRAYLR